MDRKIAEAILAQGHAFVIDNAWNVEQVPVVRLEVPRHPRFIETTRTVIGRNEKRLGERCFLTRAEAETDRNTRLSIDLEWAESEVQRTVEERDALLALHNALHKCSCRHRLDQHDPKDGRCLVVRRDHTNCPCRRKG